MTKSASLKNSMILLFTALIWGVAFVFQSMGNDYMKPFTFNASRNVLGFAVLLPIVLIKLKKPGFLSSEPAESAKRPNMKITLLGGVLCGLALSTASMFQQYGIQYTTVGKAGFITALYIILTPIFGLFIRKKCSWTVWVGAAASVAGMYLLCVTDGFSVSMGDVLMFVCAMFFAVQILLIDYFAPQTDGVMLACLEFLTSAVVCGIIALIVEHPTFNQLSQGIIPILYTGIMSSGVAYTLQIIGQKNFNPTIAAMIMSLESVISAVASYIAFSLGMLKADQTMTAVQIIGCVIMFIAVIFVQLPIEQWIKKKKT